MMATIFLQFPCHNMHWYSVCSLGNADRIAARWEEGHLIIDKQRALAISDFVVRSRFDRETKVNCEPLGIVFASALIRLRTEFVARQTKRRTASRNTQYKLTLMHSSICKTPHGAPKTKERSHSQSQYLYKLSFAAVCRRGGFVRRATTSLTHL